MTGQRRDLIWLLLVGGFCGALLRPAWGSDPCEAPASATPTLVSRLGTEADANPIETIEALHADGHAAVPMLVAELRVIEPDPDDSDAKWERMIWIERALRSMTGQVFRFRTNEK